jgi:hypothetical protein
MGVLDYLRTTEGPAGNIYIVSHANRDGTMSFGLDADDENSSTDFGELRAAVENRRDDFALAGQIDAQTRIHIKGCDIGRAQRMVDLVDEAFGGEGTVTAPTHQQEYRAGSAGVQENLAGMYLELPGNMRLSNAELRDAFREKYAGLGLSDERWRAMFRRAPRRRLDERPVSVRLRLPATRAQASAAAGEWFRGDPEWRVRGFTAREGTDAGGENVYRFAARHAESGQVGELTYAVEVPTDAEMEERAAEWAESHVARPDAYRTVVRRVRNGATLRVSATLQMTVYQFHNATIRDAAGAPLRPAAAPGMYYSQSQ